MKLYGTPPTRVLRAIWLLNELGLEYEHCPVDLMQGEAQRPAFLDLNPAAKVPVLVAGDVFLTDSAAILLYLADPHPQPRLIPSPLEPPSSRTLFFSSSIFSFLFFLVFFLFF